MTPYVTVFAVDRQHFLDQRQTTPSFKKLPSCFMIVSPTKTLPFQN